MDMALYKSIFIIIIIIIIIIIVIIVIINLRGRKELMCNPIYPKINFAFFFCTQALKQENQEFARVLWIKADYG